MAYRAPVLEGTKGKLKKFSTIFNNPTWQRKDLPKDKCTFVVMLTVHKKSIICKTCGTEKYFAADFELKINHDQITKFKKEHRHEE